MASSAAELLWQAYRQADGAARLALIEHYLPLVKRVCGRMSLHLPQYVDQGDLESAGVLGLMDAINNYCPERGVKFETYAVTRIRGAVIDSLRQIDFVPRTVRQKAKRLQQAMHDLQTKLGRSAEDGELAAELGISVNELHKWFLDVQAISVLSLNVPLDSDEEGADLASLLVAAPSSDPANQLLEDERIEELAEAIAHLSQREQLLLSLYYNEGLTLKEIGQVLGISESRVSQIHTAVVLKLRAKLT
ncbi:MAG TPA: FliA/WhiG family RNA polymerase sigma factor [Firmicutes bacterium]|nr:FliA/WhiG family RNA polymerase sigma factor [Bacillota bacterium]